MERNGSPPCSQLVVVTFMSQIKLVHALWSYLSMIHFSILSALGSPIKSLHALLFCTTRLTFCIHLVLQDLIQRIGLFGWLSDISCNRCSVGGVKRLYLILYSPLFTVCVTGFNLQNSTFCTHSVVMCFVWIWEQTAIISLYSINWLVFITEI